MKEYTVVALGLLGRFKSHLDSHKKMAVLVTVVLLAVLVVSSINAGHEIGKFIYYLTH